MNNHMANGCWGADRSAGIMIQVCQFFKDEDMPPPVFKQLVTKEPKLFSQD